MDKGKIFILAGPSGSGKTTIYKKLLSSRRLKGKIVRSVSVTTRPRREGEVHGRDYFFISRKLFLYKKRSGHLLEWERVFDHYYGTPKRAVLQLLKKGKNVLLCIDVKGARTVIREYPEAVKLFIKPPSMRILKERLRKRGTESKESFRLRIEVARREMAEAKRYDYAVINDRLVKAVKSLESIIGQHIQK